MNDDFGIKGCVCFRDEVDVTQSDGQVKHIPGRWLPNAACVHHGILADFTERMETGAYTVITKPVTIEPRQDITAPLDWPCDEGEDLRTDFHPADCPNPCGANPMDCPGPAADGACLSPTTEEESQRGLRAAARRWARRFSDWLDPHAEHRREYRRLLAEWRRDRD